MTEPKAKPNLMDEIMPKFNSEDATAITGVLQRIQELFYSTSEFKDGPKAGKVNLEQFKQGKSNQLNFDRIFSCLDKWLICIECGGAGWKV